MKKLFLFSLSFSLFFSTAFAQEFGVRLLSLNSDPVTVVPIPILVEFKYPVSKPKPEDFIITHNNLKISKIIKGVDPDGTTGKRYILKLTPDGSNLGNNEAIAGEITVTLKQGASTYLYKKDGKTITLENNESNTVTLNYQPSCDDLNMKETEFCIQLTEQMGQNVVVRGETGLDLFGNYLVIIYRYAASIIGVIAVLIVVVGGVMIIMGGSNNEMINNAKELITKAIVSLILLFLIGLILKTVNPSFYSVHECEDGIDNDGDFTTDGNDSGCKGYVNGSNAYQYYEAKMVPECSDGKDNNGNDLKDAEVEVKIENGQEVTKRNENCFPGGVYDPLIESEGSNIGPKNKP